MSEPTIEQVLSDEYWEQKYPSDYMGRTSSLCGYVVEMTLRAVLKELVHEINSASGIEDIAFRACRFRNRLRTILGDGR